MNQKPLRIIAPLSKDLFVSTGSAYTGAQHFSSLFLKHFDQTPHTVIGVAFEKPPESEGVTFRTEKRANGNPWLWVSLFLSTNDILGTTEGAMTSKTDEIIEKISDQFKELGADIFFLNGLSALTYLLFLGAKRAGLPVVSTHHGIWAIEAEAHPALANIPRAINLRKEVEKNIVVGSKKNIFLTELSYLMFSKTISPVPKEQLVYISLPYNPVFSEKNHLRSTSISSAKNIGLIGRWDPIKNHEAYLSLALEAKNQNLPWTFYAATSPSSQVTALAPILDEYLKNISIVEHLPPSQLKDFYRKLDVVVVPSHFETFCGVVMESLLQDIPVLVAPNVGTSDILRKHHLDSWITSFDSPKDAIEKLKIEITGSVPSIVREDILTNNAAEKIFKQYEEVFESVVNAS